MQPDTLEDTRLAAVRAGRLLRLGMLGHASQLVVEVVDGVDQLMRDVDPSYAKPLGMILAEIVAAQERGDLLRQADLLEYELAPGMVEALTGGLRRAG